MFIREDLASSPVWERFWYTHIMLYFTSTRWILATSVHGIQVTYLAHVNQISYAVAGISLETIMNTKCVVFFKCWMVKRNKSRKSSYKSWLASHSSKITWFTTYKKESQDLFVWKIKMKDWKCMVAPVLHHLPNLITWGVAGSARSLQAKKQLQFFCMD